MADEPSSTMSKLTFLETVYPPISNQEAVWLQTDPDVERTMRQSDFYMIGGRAEAKYQNLSVDSDEDTLTFDFVVGNDLRDQVTLRLRELPGVAASGVDEYW